jgi:phage repressor protein C with HTH and peptisase S24 domain
MQEKSIIKQNILKFIDFKGITAYKFYQETGITRGILSQNNGMSEENTTKFLAHYPEVDPEWLLTSKGEMLKNKLDVVNEPSEVYRLKTDVNIKDQSVPLYNLEASAGIVTLFSDSKESTPIDFIKIPGLPKCDGAVYVTGDSMYPLLKSGDIVMYKQMQNCIEDIYWGQMYLISIDQGGDEMVMVKYIQKSEKGEGYIKLVSQNSHHQDKDLQLKKVRALALIKASIRINCMS